MTTKQLVDIEYIFCREYLHMHYVICVSQSFSLRAWLKPYVVNIYRSQNNTLIKYLKQYRSICFEVSILYRTIYYKNRICTYFLFSYRRKMIGIFSMYFK